MCPEVEKALPTGKSTVNGGISGMSSRDHDTALDDATLERRAREIAAFGRFLDSSIRLPGGFRVGWDGIIGLIPGVGDVVGLGLSGWLVWRAVELGLPGGVILRMLGNVAIETVIGVIPVLGDLFDFVFKANIRNVALLQRELERRRGTAFGKPDLGDESGERK